MVGMSTLIAGFFQLFRPAAGPSRTDHVIRPVARIRATRQHRAVTHTRTRHGAQHHSARGGDPRQHPHRPVAREPGHGENDRREHDARRAPARLRQRFAPVAQPAARGPDHGMGAGRRHERSGPSPVQDGHRRHGRAVHRRDGEGHHADRRQGRRQRAAQPEGVRHPQGPVQNLARHRARVRAQRRAHRARDRGPPGRRRGSCASTPRGRRRRKSTRSPI